MKTKLSRSFTVLFVILLSFSSIGTLTINGQEKDTFTGDIHGNTCIKSDGSIEPSTAPMQIEGKVYTITDDFHGAHLRVEKSNIIVDGNGHKLYQNILLHHATNVTIKNFLITTSGSGINLDHSPNNTITNNTIWGYRYESSPEMGPMGAAIFIHGGDSNLVYGNNIYSNLNGIMVYGSPNTLFYNNNFFNNQFDVVDFGGLGFGSVPSIALFDNGEIGNYWDKYTGKDNNNNDGIGDTPYIINENNQDNYPLMTPTSTSYWINEYRGFYIQKVDNKYIVSENFLETYISPLFSTLEEAKEWIDSGPTATPNPSTEFPTTIVLASVVILSIVTAGIFAYFKKYKRRP